MSALLSTSCAGGPAPSSAGHHETSLEELLASTCMSMLFRSSLASFLRLSRSIWILGDNITHLYRCMETKVTHSCFNVPRSSFMRVLSVSTSLLSAVVAARIAAVSFLVSILVSDRSSESAALNKYACYEHESSENECVRAQDSRNREGIQLTLSRS